MKDEKFTCNSNCMCVVDGCNGSGAMHSLILQGAKYWKVD